MKVGNDEVRPLFEAFGTVTECEVIKNYGSVSHSSFCASITLKNYFVCLYGNFFGDILFDLQVCPHGL